MDRRQYFNELERLLNQRRVEGVNEILADYNEILNEKIAQGQTEEEVLESWGSPDFIASQYEDNSSTFDKFTNNVNDKVNNSGLSGEGFLKFIAFQILNVFLIGPYLGFTFGMFGIIIGFVAATIGLFAAKIHLMITVGTFSTVFSVLLVALLIALLVFIISLSISVIRIWYKLSYNYVVYNINIIKQEPVAKCNMKISKKGPIIALISLLAVIILGGFTYEEIKDDLKKYLGENGQVITSLFYDKDDVNEYVIDNVGDFDRIDISKVADVEIISGNKNRITVYAEDRDDVEIDFDRNTLRIEGDVDFDFPFFYNVKYSRVVIEVEGDIDSIDIDAVDVIIEANVERYDIDAVSVDFDVDYEHVELIDIDTVNINLKLENAEDVDVISIDSVDADIEVNNSKVKDIEIDSVSLTAELIDCKIKNYDVNSVSATTTVDGSSIENYDVDAVDNNKKER